MSSAFSIALSSLKAESDAINSTGHNLANINTTGFKGSNVDFRDLVASTLGGGGANSQFGLGVSRPLNHQIFSQGAISSSSSPWAVAIQGNGFFMAKTAEGQQVYTRDGDFTLSSTGELQTLGGAKVQGWTATAGVINTAGAPANLTLSTGSVVPPIASSKLLVNANLNAAGVAPATNTLSVPVQMTDSLGNNHTVTITFTKSASLANTWTYDATIPGEQLSGGTPGTPTSILGGTPGTLTFNSDGTLSTALQAPIALNVNGLIDGANNIAVSWSPVGADGTSAITQFSQASTYDVTIDGSQASQLSSIGIGNGGNIVASYSNGTQKIAGQLALANFRNTDSLQDIGNNLFTVTGQTSSVSIGIPETGGRGQVLAGSLEGSNVDIATQFTNLITYQRGYQASSRVITTADQMLQDVMAIIR